MTVKINLDHIELLAGEGPIAGKVVLALVARIRELEAGTDSLLEVLHEVVPQSELIDQDDRYRKVRAILEKGAVLR